ncbi:hypothetical protein TL16_g11997 [Triparma laevis f. inornata]|uniref:Uncharacterized protein n=1 Tax=Triparma laevis f. inornata TaxID=1714386 RepID=A0A9W7EUM1_9STRA|nr:hypothetical protein TL16_g11997 [Triparma laevis f. inornata]
MADQDRELQHLRICRGHCVGPLPQRASASAKGKRKRKAQPAAEAEVDPAASYKIDGAWTRSVRGADLPTGDECLPTGDECLEWMAYSASLDCLIAGTSGHGCTYALDVAALMLRAERSGTRGAATCSRRSSSRSTRRPTRSGWRRGAYGDPPMIVSVACVSSREKLGVISTSALGGDTAVVSGVALSEGEAFVATCKVIKVFSRTEREEGVALEDVDQTVDVSEEVARGYVLLRELAVNEPAHDVLWSDGKLVVFTSSGVRFLSRDGTELRSWTTTGEPHPGQRPYTPQCAAVCGGSGGDRPQELAVLDTNGNIHFYT